MAADGYVLSTVADSARPIHPDTLTGAWRRAAVKAGHPEVRLLDLRHWSASVLIDAGEDPVVVASRLGHADPSTTRRFYAASMDASEQRAAATVGQLLAELG
jgi:integrase